MGYSDDGLKWAFEKDPITFYNEKGEVVKLHYTYDPRVVEIENVYYVIWCNNFYGPTIRMAKTLDFKKFIILDNGFLPFNRNGVLFPRKVNGSYLMLNRPSDGGHTAFGDIFISQSYDLEHWGRHRHVMTKGGQNWWSSLKIGAGPSPIETDEGWLLLYHGVIGNCNGYVYSMGVAVLDKDEPSKVKYRSKNFILTPEMPYEEVGFVPNVVFPCATLYDKEGRIAIYYGAADSYVAVAFSTVDILINYAKEHHEVVGDDDQEGR